MTKTAMESVQIETDSLNKSFTFTLGENVKPIVISTNSGVMSSCFRKDPRILLKEAEAEVHRITKECRATIVQCLWEYPMISAPPVEHVNLRDTDLAKVCTLMHIASIKLEDSINHLLLADEDAYQGTARTIFRDLYPLRRLFDLRIVAIEDKLKSDQALEECGGIHAVDLLHLIGYVFAMTTWLRDSAVMSSRSVPTPTQGASAIINTCRLREFEGGNDAAKLFRDLRFYAALARKDLYSNHSTTPASDGPKYHEAL